MVFSSRFIVAHVKWFIRTFYMIKHTI